MLSALLFALLSQAPTVNPCAQNKRPESAVCGVGHVAVRGGTHHVRGRFWTEPIYPCGGAYKKPVPPRPAGPGLLVQVRAGTDGSGPLVADVYTDGSSAFEVTLPPGTWCFAGGGGRPCDFVVGIREDSPEVIERGIMPRARPCPDFGRGPAIP